MVQRLRAKYATTLRTRMVYTFTKIRSHPLDDHKYHLEAPVLGLLLDLAQDQIHYDHIYRILDFINRHQGLPCNTFAQDLNDLWILPHGMIRDLCRH